MSDNTTESIRSKNDQVLDRFLATAYWQDDEASGILSTDCSLEFPYAPPGMPKKFQGPMRNVLFDWFRRTVKDWSRHEIVKYPTKDPSRFWVESTTKANVTWGGSINRKFDCAHVELVVIEDGKVALSKSWSDPLAYYLAAGMNLPVFNYDGKSGIVASPLPDAPDPNPPKTEKEKAARRTFLFDYFLRPDFFDPDRDGPNHAHYFQSNRTMELPFMPAGMQRKFDENFFESTKDWMGRTLVEWHQTEDFHQDEFLDPDVCIAETHGSYGSVKWDPNGATSGYFQCYVMKVNLKDFKVAKFTEYLDPINKLLAAGALIPCFPFFY